MENQVIPPPYLVGGAVVVCIAVLLYLLKRSGKGGFAASFWPFSVSQKEEKAKHTFKQVAGHDAKAKLETDLPIEGVQIAEHDAHLDVKK